MSKSISELLKGLSKMGVEPSSSSPTLFNPDIPGDTAGLDDKKEIKPQYYNVYSTKGLTTPSSQRRNGMGSLPRHTNMTSKQEFETSNSNIDPNVIRARTNPDASLPSLNSLTKQSLMPESVQPPHNQVNLIQAAHGSELNFKNRYNPSTQPQMPQFSKEAQLEQPIGPGEDDDEVVGPTQS